MGCKSHKKVVKKVAKRANRRQTKKRGGVKVVLDRIKTLM